MEGKSLSELQVLERQLIYAKEQMMAQAKAQYLQSKKHVLFSLFENGRVGPCDFKTHDRYVRKQVARKLVIEIVNLGLNLRDLLWLETDLLREIAERPDVFLNGHEMISHADAFLKWLQRLYMERMTITHQPPGGPKIPEEEKKTKDKSPDYQYYNIVVRHIPFECLCFRQPRLDDVHFQFRSDLLAIDLQEMIWSSRSFGIRRHHKKYRYVSGFYYMELPVDMTQPIPHLKEGAIIQVNIGERDTE